MERTPGATVRAIGLLGALLFGAACTEPQEVRLGKAFDEATAALRDGQLARAVALADEALPPGSEADSAAAWALKLLRAEAEIARQRPEEALATVHASLPSGPEFAPLRARQRYLEARTSVLAGALQPALDLLEEATAIAPDDPTLRLDAEVLGGQIRLRLGRFVEGDARLEVIVNEAHRTGNQYYEALALTNLGMGRLVRGRCDEALDWFERVLELRALDQTTVYATALNNAGACYTRLGQFERAIGLQRRAIERHERGDRARELQQALGELGSTYLAQEDFESGLPYLERAFEIAGAAGVAADTALWARNLSAAYVHLGRWDEADKYNAEARRLNPPDRGDKAAYDLLHAGHIAAGRGQLAAAERLLQDALAAGKPDPAVQWAAYDGLARLAARQDRPAVARQRFETALGVIEATRSDLLKTDYRLSFLTRLIGFYQGYVDALVDQGQNERALEIADSSRGRVLAERQNVSAPALRANATALRRLARESGAVLLSYWLTPSRSHLWVVTADQVRRVTLPPAHDIEVLVREHQRAIENATADVLANADTAGDRLYAILFEPVARWLPAGSKIVIAPDGALHRLNFETLPVKASGIGVNSRHYLVEDFEFQVAPALSLVGQPTAPPKPDARVLLIGNPRPREPEFPSLAYAPAEMEAIARHFPGDRVTTFRSDEASPAAYTSAGAERYAMIHFTAHATANADSPLDSAVILSGPDNAYKLYARDIVGDRGSGIGDRGARPLLIAELVTISACRSAGERAYSGEGLVGFAWAFLRAGSRRVVAGLWDVDDRSTATLMDRFYAGIAAGAPPARALREAKLALMKSGANYGKPYYWAAFQMFTVAL